MRSTITLAALALVLAACASAGNQVLRDQNSDSVDQQLHDGQSTKAEVKAIYGDPTDTTFTDGGNEIWKYAYAYATPMAVNFVPIVGIFAGGANVDKKELVILFDQKGTVMKHTMNVSKQAVQRGQ